MNIQSWVVLGMVIALLAIVIFVIYKNRDSGCKCCSNKNCCKSNCDKNEKQV